MRRGLVVVFALGMLSVLAVGARAELDAGLGYPFLSVKYDFMPELSGEAKVAFQDGVDVYAARGYYNFFRAQSFHAFAGLELGGVAFNTLGISGSGAEYGAFVGGEYRVLPELGVSLDLGPSMINLTSQGTSNGGLEWVVTAAVYWRVL